MTSKSDPTKDLKFHQVAQTFLRTPSKPHAKKKQARKKAVRGKRSA
jgi:hypothetical protein